MQKLVEIRRFDNPVEAHVLLDLLTDAGIPARIFDEHVGSALPHYGMIGVRVVVRAEDATRAEAVIAEEKAARRHAPDDADEEIPWKGTEGGDGGGAPPDVATDEAEVDAGVDGEEPGDDEPGDDEPAPTPHEPPALPTPASAPPGEEALVAWAWKTRALAFLGVATFFFAGGVLFRVTRPPEGIRTSARAMRLLHQAQWVAWLTIGAYFAVFLWIWWG